MLTSRNVGHRNVMASSLLTGGVDICNQLPVATEARSLSALIAPSTATDASQAVRDRLTQPACAANYYVCIQGIRMTALLLYAKDL
jgi:hypothetical protein